MDEKTVKKNFEILRRLLIDKRFVPTAEHYKMVDNLEEELNKAFDVIEKPPKKKAKNQASFAEIDDDFPEIE